MNRSYWEAELYRQHYDLIVIGAGLTGLSTALFYKRAHPNTKVLLIDRGLFPAGASTRNAGFACIGSVGELLADLEIDSEESLKERIKSRYEGLKLLRSTLGDEAIEYNPCGGWEIFTEQEKFDEAAANIPKFNDWMEELIGISECYKVGDFEGYSAIFNAAEGALHTGKMVRRLLNLVIEAGVEIRWETTVSEIDVDEGFIKTQKSLEFSANKVVLATNAFTASITKNEYIKPGRGYVFVTNKLAEMPWKGTFHFNEGYTYFRNIGDDRLLLGGARDVDYETETTGEFGVNPKIKESLISFANKVLKLPPGWEIELEWSGIMGFTESKNARKEWIGERTLEVAGLSGMGVALGMNLGLSASKMLRVN